jgi:CRISPR/Cas system CMR-associated protein Cmr5 small subunit
LFKSKEKHLKQGEKISNLKNASQNLIYLPLKKIYKRICKNKTCGASVVQNIKNKETIHARIYIGAILSNLCTYKLCKLVHYALLYLLWFVLASITKKGEIERELGLHLFPN